MSKSFIKEFYEKNKSYCAMPFKEIYSDNTGFYKLCCHAKQTNELKKFTTQNTTPFEFFNSTEMEEIRNKMLIGEKIKTCETCYKLEEDAGVSYRNGKYLDKYGVDVEVKNIGLKLRIHGSYCNLGCYMCHPYNSSTRRNELKAVYGDAYKKIPGFEIDFKPVKFSQYEKIKQNILDNIHLVGYMNMTGGEPLQLPKHWELVNAIPEEHAKHITIGYDTNLTKLRWKNHSVWDLADKFEEINLGVSCDHYGEKLKWIRYPIDVEEFESNISEARELVTRLNCTVSILNIEDLYEMSVYYRKKFNVDITFHNIARGPGFLSIRNLPDKYKTEYMRRYSELDYVIDELQKDPISSNQLQKAFKYCDDLSKHRKFNWRDLWPNFLT